MTHSAPRVIVTSYWLNELYFTMVHVIFFYYKFIKESKSSSFDNIIVRIYIQFFIDILRH